MSTRRKLFCGVLLSLLLFSSFSGASAAADTVTIVVNRSTIGSSGTVSALSSEQPTDASESAAQIPAGVSGMRIDPETGDVLYIREMRLPESLPELDGTQEDALVLMSATQIGTQRSILDSGGASHTMECRYIGQYCTVWTCVSDAKTASKLKMSDANAEKIGEQFDSLAPDEIDAFGSWYDADGDGKLAIFCYDLDNDYVSGLGDSYTAGYFLPYNLLDSSGYAGGKTRFIQNYERTYCQYLGISCDCIHLDTYPGMGQLSLFDDVEGAYSTLFHETQHLINYSYQISAQSCYGGMESYLDEAFAMAAEHMLCGSDATAIRVRYFNRSDYYTQGSPLTSWNGSLDNYSNSYLFGQYLRTRYAQKTGTDGSAIFREVLETRQKARGGDTLKMIAELLDSNPSMLILDFWTAVYRKDASGIYGFNGESWADEIRPYLQTLSKKGISVRSGGAVFLKNAPALKTSSVLSRIDPTEPQIGALPRLSDVSASRTQAAEASLTLRSSKDGTLWYSFTREALFSPKKDADSLSLSSGDNTLTVPLPDSSPGSRRLYYLSEGTDGLLSDIRSLKIPLYRCLVTVQTAEHGSISVLCDGAAVQSGDRLAPDSELSVQAVPDVGYRLDALTLNGAPLTAAAFTLTGDAVLSASFTAVLPGKTVSGGGACGEGVRWAFYDDGTLCFYGSGTADSYSAGSAPWYALRAQITSVVVTEGVTGVGSHAFSGCTAVEKLLYYGTESQLASLTALTDLPQDAECVCISLRVADAALSGSEISLTADLFGAEEATVRLIAAFYRADGAMLALSMENASLQDEVLHTMTVVPPEGFASCRLFLLGSSTLRPLCEAVPLP